MRIAIIAPPWLTVPPLAYGGTEAVLDTLARGLVRTGHEVLLCTTADSTCPVPKAWILPQAVGTNATGAATELSHVIHAYDAISVWGADLVHDHTLVGPVYARDRAVPVVTTNHGPFTGELGDLYRAIAGTVPVIAISAHHAASAGSIPVAATIHHGVDLEQFPAGTGQGGYALFLGRMSPDKGVDVAIRAAHATGMHLKIAAKMAEPGEREYFHTVVQPLLDPRTEFLGEVNGPQKLKLLGEATCLLNPIRWAEPFGMVMVEALACGTPVIASDHGSVTEIVDDGLTGFVCETEAELVPALGQVSDLDRNQCRATVRERFSSQRMVADHLAFYRSVLTEKRPSVSSRPLAGTWEA